MKEALLFRLRADIQSASRLVLRRRRIRWYSAQCIFIRRLLAHVQRIPSLVFFDLKSQEVMNCAQGFGTVRRYANTRSLFRLFECVLNIALQLLHDWDARRDLIMYQHWRFEVSSGKHLRDMAQMHSDLITTLRILGGVSGNFD